MAFERQFTAKEAALAVLKKTQELLEKSEFTKSEKLKKDGGQTLGGAIGFPGSPPTVNKSEQPKGEIHPKEHVEGEPTNKVQGRPAPEKNPHEQKEGNNELAGTTPTQVGQDGKNVPGFDEMLSGHLKLAKFIGRMEHKRSLRKSEEMTKGQDSSLSRVVETGHEKGVHTFGSAAGASRGRSQAGAQLTNAPFSSPKEGEKLKEAAKEGHKKVLEEMKQIKPNLPAKRRGRYG